MNQAFDAIANFYGARRTKRSGVLLMNHITEGLKVLDAIGASQAAKDAFCLHPMFQADDDLVANLGRAGEFDPYVMTLVMEYRARANAALSDRVGHHLDGSGAVFWMGAPATPGPLTEVRQMLIADKVQNYADFLIYHAETHPRRRELAFYFDHWLTVLNIDRGRYAELVERMKA